LPAFAELIPTTVIGEYVKTYMPKGTYYHFYLIGQQSAHIIVPGKRGRNYRVEKRIAEGDEIARIEKQKKCPF
jgi:hypothetical protein